MSTVHFSAAPLAAEKIDAVNAIIRGVSVITSGLIARGHDLAVDDTTLAQMLACAKATGQVPVKIDHKSGAGAICGYLTNFRREGDKLKADWHLLQTHPAKDQILETAQRMPRGVGLSASFISPEHAEAGKARCEELISVDYVTLPAANPDGMFDARDPREPQKPQRLSGVEKVRRVIGAAAHGAKTGAALGVASRFVLPRRFRPEESATAGAVLGAIGAGAYRWRLDSARGLSARVAEITFENRAALRRLTESVNNNISPPLPGADEASAVADIARKPLVRRAATRALKVGAGAGLGYAIGRKHGSKAGAITGAVAGLLFENRETRNTVQLAIARAHSAQNL